MTLELWMDDDGDIVCRHRVATLTSEGQATALVLSIEFDDPEDGILIRNGEELRYKSGIGWGTDPYEVEIFHDHDEWQARAKSRLLKMVTTRAHEQQVAPVTFAVLGEAIFGAWSHGDVVGHFLTYGVTSILEYWRAVIEGEQEGPGGA